MQREPTPQDIEQIGDNHAGEGGVVMGEGEGGARAEVSRVSEEVRVRGYTQ